MKKVVAILMCICVLTVPAFAVNSDDYWYQDDSGAWVYDEDSYDAAVAAEKVAAAGLALDVNSYWVTNWLNVTYFDNAAFEADYAAALEEKASQQEPVPQEPRESESTSDEITDTSTTDQSTNDTTSDSGYPVGSYIDEAGNVFSPEGELLSPGTTPASDPDIGGTVSDILLDTEDTSQVEISDSADSGDSDNSVIILGLNQATQASGLKALIIEIFGEYEPLSYVVQSEEMGGGLLQSVSTVEGDISTSQVITQTMPINGIAGADFEWLAGVFLFSIMLYCLMKLLGGILK